MPRRVFLHIGTPKSGTSYLQDKCALNRELLARQGLSYPHTRSGGHFEAALDLIDEPWAGLRESARGQWADLVNDVRRAPRDVLVSHEILAAAPAASVERAMESFPGQEIHLVLTARDLARQIPAEWQETAKHRGRRTFTGFNLRLIEAPRTNPSLWFWRVQSVPDVLTRWGNGVEPNRIHVVTVPPPGAPPTALWERFATVVGLDPRADYEESDALNRSLGIAETQVLRRVNRLIRPKEVPREAYADLVRELIARETLAGRETAIAPVLPPARWPWANEVADEWCEWLEGAGVDVVGDLDDLRPGEPEPRGAVHPDHAPAEDVADAAIVALAAVLREVGPHHTSRVRRIARRLLRP